MEADAGPVFVLRTEEGVEPYEDEDESGSTTCADVPKAVREGGTMSATSLTINLVNATLGSGMLSLPWAMAGASLVVGSVLTLLVLLLNLVTNVILVHAADGYLAFDLGALLGHLPGRWARPARVFCDASIWFSIGLCLVGYFVVVADSLEPFLPLDGISSGCGRAIIIASATLLVLPLCFVDENRLAVTSSMSIAVNVYLLAYVFVEFVSRDVLGTKTAGSCILGQGPGAITMTSALMQAIIFQMCTLPMYESLEERTPRKFARCLTIAFIFVLVLFISFSIMALILYGRNVDSNILVNLPQTPAGDIARVGMGLSVLGVYPIYAGSMTAPLRHAEARAARREQVLAFPSPSSPTMSSPWATPAGASPFGVPLLADSGETPWRRWGLQRLRLKLWSFRTHVPAKPSHLATVAIVLTTAFGGWCTSDLGTLNIVNGASQVAIMIGWAPGLVGIFLLHSSSWVWKASMWLLIIFSTLMSIVGIAYTDNSASQLDCFWAIGSSR